MRQLIRAREWTDGSAGRFYYGARPFGQCCRAGALLLLLGACVIGAARESKAQQEPETPVVWIRGDVTIWRNQDPVTTGKVLVYLDENVQPAQYTLLDINSTTGHFEGRFQSGLHYIVRPVFSFPDDPDNRNALIRSIPSVHSGLLGPSDTTIDFAIHPGVFVDVNQSGNMPSIGGMSAMVAVPYIYTPPFPSFVHGTRAIVVYPDDYMDELDQLMPLSGTLNLINLPPFTTATPQNAGLPMLFDCSHSMIDFDTPKIRHQSVVQASDWTANYSWDNPGGIGWSYFPKTPDNRLPNNPNVHVTAQFAYLGAVQHNFVRMHGVYSSQDLTHSNGYKGIFDLPIPECGPLDLQIEFQLRMQNGLYQWFPLATHLATSASDANLQAQDQVINLSDVAILAQTIGLCAGQSGYNACADFAPDNCVNTADVSVFADIWYNYPKSVMDLGGVDGAVSFVPTETGSIQCIIEASEPWSVCVVRFILEGLASGDLTWTAESQFTDRSVLAPHDVDDDVTSDLFVFGPHGAGTTVLGEIAIADKRRPATPRLVGMGLASSSDGSESRTVAERPFAQLGDVAPNPFNPETKLSFELSQAQDVSLVVYDLSGRAVRTLIADETRGAGRHELTWNGKDDRGHAVASGVYLYRLLGEGVDLTKRMTLLE